MAVKEYISVSADSTKVAKTTDYGATWTTIYNGTSLCGTLSSEGNHLRKSIAYGPAYPGGPKYYVVIGSSGYAYSSNGVNWGVQTYEAFSDRTIVNDGTKFVFLKVNLTDSSLLDVCNIDSNMSNYYLTGATLPAGGNWSFDAAPYVFDGHYGTIAFSYILGGTNQVNVRMSTDSGLTWTLSYQPTDTITKLSNITYYSHDRFLVIGQGSTSTSFVIFKYNGSWSKLSATASSAYTASTLNIAASYNPGVSLHQFDIIPIGVSTSGHWAGNPDSSAITYRGFGTSITAKKINEFKRITSSESSTYFISKTAGGHYSNDLSSWTGISTPFVFSEVATKDIVSESKFAVSTATPLVSSHVYKFITAAFTAVSNSVAASLVVIRFVREHFATSASYASVLKTISARRISTSTSNALKRISKIWAKPWSIIYAASKWIGVKHNSSTAVTSTDGKNWASRTLPANQYWTGVANNGTITASIATNSSVAASSSDGITWVSRTLPIQKHWTTLVAGGSTFVGVASESDKCIRSTDGITWTEHSMPSFANWTGVAWNGTVFCAITDSSVAATSPDGITWTQRTMPDNIHYNSIVWGLGQFTAVASGPTNKAAKSADGITWTQITMPSSQDWTSVGLGVGNA